VNARRVIIGEISPQEYHDLQQTQLLRASSTRGCFTLAVFGDIMWTRTGEMWTRTRHIPMRVSYQLSEDNAPDTTESEDSKESNLTDDDLDGDEGEYRFEPESEEDDLYVLGGIIASATHNHDSEASEANPLPIPMSFLSDASVYPTFPATYFIPSQNDM